MSPPHSWADEEICEEFYNQTSSAISVLSLWPALVFLIGYTADTGHMLSDDLSKKARPRAIAIFVFGFWILDVETNMLPRPCRAFLADLSAGDQRKTRTYNAGFSFFMVVGNVLGYAAGSYSKLYHVFPFTKTKACDEYCANLKSCLFLSIALLLTLSVSALIYVKERVMVSEKSASVAGAEDEGTRGMSCFELRRKIK